MARIFYLSLLLFCIDNQSIGQKKIIDIEAIRKWPSLGVPSISCNGMYAFYVIENLPVGHFTTVVRSTNTNWKLELLDAGFGQISQNCEKFIFKRNDSIGILTLGSPFIRYIPRVSSFKIFNLGKYNDWLVYRSLDSSDDLIIENIQSKNKQVYNFVREYWFNEDGRDLILQIKKDKDDKLKQDVEWVDLSNNTIQKIWAGGEIINLVFNKEDNGLVFLTRGKGALQENEILYYRTGDTVAIKILDDQSLDSGLIIDNLMAFNSDRGKIFFRLKSRIRENKAKDVAKVDIWNYKDPVLQSQQLNELKRPNIFAPPPYNYLAVLDIYSKKVVRLEHEQEWIRSYKDDLDHAILLKYGSGDALTEWNWNNNARISVYLISLIDGTKRLIEKNITQFSAWQYILSPNGKYVIYYEPIKKLFFSYIVFSGVKVVLTKNVHADWTTFDRDDEPMHSYFPFGVAGFIDNGISALVYDQHDIYRIDPEGKIPAINLTNGYGKKYNLVFRFALGSYGAMFRDKEQIILSVFNRTTKESGFALLRNDFAQNPKLLTLQHFIFNEPDESQYVPIFSPIKARDTAIYLVRRMSESQFPNYFCTKNFKEFAAFSDLSPEKQYNWLTAELVTWKTLDNSISQGILYKPENFDPHKKYPVIIKYYEKISETLHQYIRPNLAQGPMNISFYVSNGYLVFAPDIHYKIGSPGKSAYNTVVSAAALLAKKPYIDSKKIGIQGHSFGGFETNYIITHSHLFAAAMSSSGMSNFVSIYGSIIGDGSSRQRQYELYRDRIGATLWKNLPLYLENSPVLRADKITTPLLMMANKEDGDVPFSQGIEMFTALRRLGKKAWMLQYDGQGHLVFGKASEDLTIRMIQFFNYYLKGALPPRWMTEGIPARLKGSQDGLDLDTSGKKP